MQVQGGATSAVRIRAYSFTGTEGDTDVINDLKNTSVALVAASLTINGVDASTLSAISVDVDGDSVVVEGVSAGDVIAFTAVSDFEAVQISNADGDPDGVGGSYAGDAFAIGEFGFDSAVQGDEVALSFDLQSTDADGDVASGILDVTISPEGHVATGTEMNEVLIGDSGADILVGGGGDDILIGNDGNDILTGGTGADVFVWTAGQSGTDQVTDFNIAEGDVLDIADLLVGEQDPTAADLESYLSIATGTDTTITIFGNGGDADQIIQLTGFDTTGMTGQQVLENLLLSNSIITD